MLKTKKITSTIFANEQIKHYEKRAKRADKIFKFLVWSLFIVNFFILILLSFAMWVIFDTKEILEVSEIVSISFSLVLIVLLLIINSVISIVRTIRRAKFWWKALDEIQLEIAKYRYSMKEYKKIQNPEELLLKKVKRIEKKYDLKNDKKSFKKILILAMKGETYEF